MEIDWPVQFGAWLDTLEADAESGNALAKLKLKYVAEALTVLRELPESPSEDTETGDLKRVRQRRRYELWRISHPYDPKVAVRLICWFPPKHNTVVVALFAGDKALIGDDWYNSVANQADPLIDSWKREVDYDDTNK